MIVSESGVMLRLRSAGSSFRAEDTAQFVTLPPSDMHQHIGDLLSSGQEDVTFQVGEETVAAHRLILGARSPVFKLLLHI